MPSSARATTLALFLFLALAACGRGVDDLELSAASVTSVAGHVDLASLQGLGPGAHLRAALVWGATPNYVIACAKYPEKSDLQVACPDPFGFVPGLVEGEVEVPSHGDGRFSIPIQRLPSAAVSIGTATGRIAWGSLVLVEDANANGVVELLTRPVLPFEQPRFADRVLAASFFSMRAPQQRIAFREGAWDAQSLFYPAPGCDPPPEGFSVFDAPPLDLVAFGIGQPSLMALLPAMSGGALPASPPGGGCTSREIRARVELVPLPAVEAQGFACRSTNRAPVRTPPIEAPGQDPMGPHGDIEGPDLRGRQICLDAETLVIIGEGDCPTLTTLPLAGCRNNWLCETPDWDFRQQKPEWWPCGP